MFQAIMGITFFAAFAMMVREGLWSNTITLINVLFSGVVAFGLYPPLTIWLDEKLSGEFTYVLDFVMVWFVFGVSMIVCRLATGFASRTRMRFRHPIDPVGGPLVGLLAAWAITAFGTATLFMAPMPKGAFGDRLSKAAEQLDKNQQIAVTAITSPDLAWLDFMERVTPAQSLGRPGGPVFSPKRFVASHTIHRDALERSNATWLKVKR
jgi:hypothetical protein